MERSPFDAPFEQSSPADEVTPPTEPKGALVPPPRVLPTAIASSEQPPPSPRSPRPHAVAQRPVGGLRGVIDAVLAVLDDLGDRIAAASGLRMAGEDSAPEAAPPSV